jgi:hypothetical protein
MNRDQFGLFMEVLRILEKEDTGGNVIENAIIAVIDSFDRELTREQKGEMLREFLRYETLRQARDEKKDKIREELNYQELVEKAIAFDTPSSSELP